MCIVFHFTVNIKFCICLTGYKYILNVSKSFTTLTSFLGPTTLQLLKAASTGRGVPALQLPAAAAAAAAPCSGRSSLRRQQQLWKEVTNQLCVNYRLLFFLEFPCTKKNINSKNTNLKKNISRSL